MTESKNLIYFERTIKQPVRRTFANRWTDQTMGPTLTVSEIPEELVAHARATRKRIVFQEPRYRNGTKWRIVDFSKAVPTKKVVKMLSWVAKEILSEGWDKEKSMFIGWIGRDKKAAWNSLALLDFVDGHALRIEVSF
jgi:hypothetical protein